MIFAILLPSKIKKTRLAPSLWRKRKPMLPLSCF